MGYASIFTGGPTAWWRADPHGYSYMLWGMTMIESFKRRADPTTVRLGRKHSLLSNIFSSECDYFTTPSTLCFPLLFDMQNPFTMGILPNQFSLGRRRLCARRLHRRGRSGSCAGDGRYPLIIRAPYFSAAQRLASSIR